MANAAILGKEQRQLSFAVCESCVKRLGKSLIQENVQDAMTYLPTCLNYAKNKLNLLV